MTKFKILLLLAFLFSSKYIHAQDDSLLGVKQIPLYKNLYHCSDSLNKKGPIWELSDDVFRLADSLDNIHPAGYFIKAGELMGKMQLNEAAFLYFVGYLRFRYYNAANPGYKNNDDGALLASYYSVPGEPIGWYLKTNIDNFIAILKKSVDWYSNHNYLFFPASKNPGKFAQPSNDLAKQTDDLIKNKEKYKSEWEQERIEFEKQIDAAMEKYKKLLGN